MFYEKQADPILRFGDVLKGFVSSTPKISKPFLNLDSLNNGYNIDIEIPDFSVVLTPCCSIEKGVITLAPLQKISGSFNPFKNPYLKDNLTRVNRKVLPENSLSPEDWSRLPDEVKEARKAGGKAFILTDIFVYDENSYFPKYPVRKEDIGSYIINFSHSYKVKCDLIKRSNGKPVEQTLIDSKFLQISIDTRSELRKKIAHYYWRVPEEDKC